MKKTPKAFNPAPSWNTGAARGFPVLAALLIGLGTGYASGISGGVPATQAILTANVDQTRTGWFSQETTLNLSNVGGGHFGALFTWPVVSRSSAQLLIAPGVVTPAGAKGSPHCYDAGREYLRLRCEQSVRKSCVEREFRAGVLKFRQCAALW